MPATLLLQPGAGSTVNGSRYSSACTQPGIGRVDNSGYIRLFHDIAFDVLNRDALDDLFAHKAPPLFRTRSSII
jgi:hypothetical protein